MDKEIANDNHDAPTDPAFVQGFNEGYIMAEYLPDVADLLYKVISNSERMAGFKAGRAEYMIEKMQEKTQQWETKEQKEARGKDHNLDKTIDEFERKWSGDKDIERE